MKMEIADNGVVTVRLSRRNLQAMLLKLDGHPTWSACTLMRETDAGLLVVIAEPDVTHYGERTPGVMHSETEVLLTDV